MGNSTICCLEIKCQKMPMDIMHDACAMFDVRSETEREQNEKCNNVLLSNALVLMDCDVSVARVYS